MTALANMYVTVIVHGQFQNQPPIGWLKKCKIENKTLLYGTVTYITALLLHIVAIHI
jgi:hypothetical protein